MEPITRSLHGYILMDVWERDKAIVLGFGSALASSGRVSDFGSWRSVFYSFLPTFCAAGADSHFVRVLFEAPLVLPANSIYRGARNCSVVKWLGKCGVLLALVIFSCQHTRLKGSGTNLFIAESMAFILCTPTHKRQQCSCVVYIYRLLISITRLLSWQVIVLLTSIIWIELSPRIARGQPCRSRRAVKHHMMQPRAFYLL